MEVVKTLNYRGLRAMMGKNSGQIDMFSLEIYDNLIPKYDYTFWIIY